MTLNNKILLNSICPLVIACIGLSVLILGQKSQVHNAIADGTAQSEELIVDAAEKATAIIAKDVFHMCRAGHEAVQQKVNSDLNVARDVMKNTGDVHLGEDTVEWGAVNQYTKTKETISLPKMMVGDTWLGNNIDMSKESPIVDKTQRLVGGTCTIFQRMNDAGDMLRVCTNVEKLDGTRAVGTFIPAVNPDSSKNTVVATVLSGETFRSRAFVVNAWYITAYEPIKDKDGKVIGMLYVGVKQENVKSLRTGIMEVAVGKQGHVYVLGGSGNQKGKFIISKDSDESTKDQAAVQGIVEKALSLSSSDDDIKVAWHYQADKTADTQNEKGIITAIAYYKPWDWIIAVEGYADDYSDTHIVMSKSYSAIKDIFVHMINLYFIILGIILISSLVISSFISKRISRPFIYAIESLTAGAEQVEAAATQVSDSSQELAQGATEQAAGLSETTTGIADMSEMVKNNADNTQQANQLTGATTQVVRNGNESMKKMNNAIEKIQASSDETSKIIKVIDEIAFQTNLLALNAAVEAARAGEAGKGFAVVAEEVRNLAMRSAEAARNTSQMIEDSVNNANSGVEICKEVDNNLTEISQSIEKVAGLLSEVDASCQEQTQNIGRISCAMADMDKVTQSNAACSEQSASAAEELSAQAEQMKMIVNEMFYSIYGKKHGKGYSSSSHSGGMSHSDNAFHHIADSHNENVYA